MQIKYDKKRSDITFCTMLFKMPDHNKLNTIKRNDRKFEEFYLKSLQKLITTFERVALWCDQETADFLKKHGLDKKIQMRVMKFSDLPQYAECDEYLECLRGMTKYRGFLLNHRKPEDWPDYMVLMMSKIAVIKWAAENNKFKSDYFMWLDTGGFNPNFARCWKDWTGTIDARPERCRFCVALTLGKARPPFVPRFINNIIKKFQNPIAPATSATLVKQSLVNIAMTNADYDVPGGSFMIPAKWAQRFAESFETTRMIMKKHGLVAVDQGIFQAMMKFDTQNMFEICYIHEYQKLYTRIAGPKPDHLL
ncbi:hypothetical protein LJC18_00890 [Lachnospiraceae bacterium OttesenSCG-928-E19]|nr:hypothetical protein [Lachnospiraceae bacterium OttesenSCG-928-E19]